MEEVICKDLLWLNISINSTNRVALDQDLWLGVFNQMTRAFTEGTINFAIWMFNS